MQKFSFYRLNFSFFKVFENFLVNNLKTRLTFLCTGEFFSSQSLKVVKICLATTIILGITTPLYAYAYPIFAQQNYENPREANGRIVCANCHLAQKPVEIEVPQSVLPDTVFEAVVKIPYDQQVKQVLGNGKKVL